VVVGDLPLTPLASGDDGLELVAGGDGRRTRTLVGIRMVR
jgi:hypothetical protein